MHALFVGLLLGLVPRGPVVEDRIDVIELNSLYDDAGNHRFDQWIGWNCSYDEPRVEWWRIARPHTLGREGGPVSVIFEDHDALRRVRAPVLKRSWTQYDPEIHNRKRFKQSRRRDLTPARK